MKEPLTLLWLTPIIDHLREQERKLLRRLTTARAVLAVVGVGDDVAE